MLKGWSSNSDNAVWQTLFKVSCGAVFATDVLPFFMDIKNEPYDANKKESVRALDDRHKAHCLWVTFFFREGMNKSVN